MYTGATDSNAADGEGGCRANTAQAERQAETIGGSGEARETRAELMGNPGERGKGGNMGSGAAGGGYDLEALATEVSTAVPWAGRQRQERGGWLAGKPRR